jgi:ribosomal protein S27E
MNANAGGESIQISQHIREGLKGFSSHAPSVTCLECGYVGMMGVKKKVVPWYVSAWLILAILILSGGALFIIAGILLLIRIKITKKMVTCPNCRQDLLIPLYGWF